MFSVHLSPGINPENYSNPEFTKKENQQISDAYRENIFEVVINRAFDEEAVINDPRILQTRLVGKYISLILNDYPEQKIFGSRSRI